MSRIGKAIIYVPSKVDVQIEGAKVTIKGPKGTLQREFHQDISIVKENDGIVIKKKLNNKQASQLHGLSRSLLYNMVYGVSQGFSKQLEIQGVGYRSQMEGKNLLLNVGYSHPVIIEPPQEIEIKVEKNNIDITVSGIDKELVGQVASKIRSIRKPEPYKGKGIRYKNEYVIRKVGKAGKGK